MKPGFCQKGACEGARSGERAAESGRLDHQQVALDAVQQSLRRATDENLLDPAARDTAGQQHVHPELAGDASLGG